MVQGSLGADNRGFVYTFISVILLVIIVSLNMHYVKVSSQQTANDINQMQTDQLKALVDSLKEDFENALRISGETALKKALVSYLINHTDTNVAVAVVNLVSHDRPRRFASSAGAVQCVHRVRRRPDLLSG